MAENLPNVPIPFILLQHIQGYLDPIYIIKSERDSKLQGSKLEGVSSVVNFITAYEESQ